MARTHIVHARVDARSAAVIADYLEQTGNTARTWSGLVGDSVELLALVLSREDRAKVYTIEEALGRLSELGLQSRKVSLQKLAKELESPEVAGKPDDKMKKALEYYEGESKKEE